MEVMLLVGHRHEDAKAQTLLARFSASVRVVNHDPMAIPDMQCEQAADEDEDDEDP